MTVADRVVIDASVGVAFLTKEVHTQHATSAIDAWRASATELLVPAHFWLELTNVLIGRKAISAEGVIAAFLDLDNLGLRTVESDRPLLLLATNEMISAQLSAYDAIYLALALSTGSKLATLDRRLAEAAGDAGMLIGSTGVSEPRVAYRTDPNAYTGWAHSAAVGAHIADLRREALADT
jgi:predicted nucleic acid-binding protein